MQKFVVSAVTSDELGDLHDADGRGTFRARVATDPR
jgi:hypothetical protein